MPLRRILIALLLLSAGEPTAQAATTAPPRVDVASVNDLSVPDAPFDAAADAQHDLDAALTRGARERKRVLIDIGANWCADCRILAGVLALPQVARFVDTHYVVVNVDIGRFNRNMQIPQRYGLPQGFDGVPVILIVSPEGRLVNPGHEQALVEARTMTPQAIADWLARWAE